MPGWLCTVRRAIGWGALIALVATVAGEGGRMFLGHNWHVVLPGRVYRSAQLSPVQLAERVRAQAVRTIVNLRGCCPDQDWYLDEARATHDLDICQEDITFSATRLPPPNEVRRLVDVIDRAEYPLLLHCRQGVDRTGLAAVVVVLLTTDVPLAEARDQLGLRFGHIPWGPTRCMTQFFGLYDQWLAARGQAHRRDLFRQWVCHEYCPGRCRGSLELLGGVPAITVGEPAVLRVRARNLSLEAWSLRPGTGTGVHVKFMVFDDSVRLCQIGRAGQFTAEVAPGGSIDLTLALAPLARPGTHTFVADLLDGVSSAFSQFGMEPIQLELRVTDRE